MVFNVLEYLEATAKRFPRRMAFSDGQEEINYSDLCSLSKAVGYNICVNYEKTKRPILVICDRSIKNILAFFGVIYSGNFYVPISREIPAKRIKIIIDDLKPEVAIIQNSDVNLLSDAGYNGRTIIIDDAVSNAIDEDTLIEIRNKSLSKDPIYAIFTSGTTGVPKAVLKDHRAIIEGVEHFTTKFGLSEKNIFGGQAPFDFDLASKDIFLPLKSGATLHFIPKNLFAFPSKLIKYLNERKINTVFWSTYVFRIIENLKGLDKELPGYLKNIFFTAEAMPNKVLNYWRKYLPNASYVNLYGPTEVAFNCLYYIVDRKFKDSDILPIGGPFPNSGFILLDENNCLVTKGEAGEICIKGTSLSMGYYNNPGKTAEVFCQNPLNLNYTETIYRTGDFGKINDRGELLYLSRKDFQIKHRGRRIELAEIEVATIAIDFIDAACCLHDTENERIVLFYQSKFECDKHIILKLREVLPNYMIPNKLIYYSKLPLNRNLKIDRIKLHNCIEGRQK